MQTHHDGTERTRMSHPTTCGLSLPCSRQSDPPPLPHARLSPDCLCTLPPHRTRECMDDDGLTSPWSLPLRGYGSTYLCREIATESATTDAPSCPSMIPAIFHNERLKCRMGFDTCWWLSIDRSWQVCGRRSENVCLLVFAVLWFSVSGFPGLLPLGFPWFWFLVSRGPPFSLVRALFTPPRRLVPGSPAATQWHSRGCPAASLSLPSGSPVFVPPVVSRWPSAQGSPAASR